MRAPAVENLEDWLRAGRPQLVLVTTREPAQRRAFVESLTEAGVRFATSVPRTNLIAPSAVFGEGALVVPPAFVGACSRVGRFVIVLAETSIGHDVVLEDFVSVGAHACVSGYVVVSEDSALGDGAVVVNGTKDRPLRIGSNALVAAGAVVTKDVPSGAYVAGNPGRRITGSAGRSRDRP